MLIYSDAKIFMGFLYVMHRRSGNLTPSSFLLSPSPPPSALSPSDQIILHPIATYLPIPTYILTQKQTGTNESIAAMLVLAVTLSPT